MGLNVLDRDEPVRKNDINILSHPSDDAGPPTNDWRIYFILKSFYFPPLSSQLPRRVAERGKLWWDQVRPLLPLAGRNPEQRMCQYGSAAT